MQAVSVFSVPFEPLEAARIPTRSAPLWALALFTLGFCTLALHVGSDASYDLRNYHIYNGLAALHGRLWFDIAPAQLQTFYAPTLDVIDFVLRQRLNDHPALLDAILALPQALAAFLALGVAMRTLPEAMPGRLPLALVAIVLGATGAAGLPTLATGMSEMLPACCVLGGLILLLDARWNTPDGLGRAIAAGLLAGAAGGLKLTAAPYAAGLAAVLLTPAGSSVRVRGLALLAFLLAAAVGACALGGVWWWTLWQRTGNPLFPYFNDLFTSTWGPPARMTDARFLPRSVLEALTFPFLWAFEPRITTEPPVQDPRLALAWLGWAVVLVRALLRREAPSRP
ncbi:MAG: hypothetical protein M3Y41_17010, partial [Pseudomonadota bacterium]|nr:hypothetical protein [Pseudomonadota bacterium]